MNPRYERYRLLYPSGKVQRLAQCYEYKNGGNEPFTHFHLCLTDYTVPPAFESGGAGLVSTVEDYAKFAKMLMNKGELDGVRILRQKRRSIHDKKRSYT